ncbi:hypothetical protein F5883DRAFT_560250 [Diaporthe sp. PMI_573]|nr:hypothetical protein F5883DRAFT_560250 [Diaporthaceae sp. PMI_573]
MLSDCHEALHKSLDKFIDRWLDLAREEPFEINGTRCSSATIESAQSIKSRGSAPVDLGSRRANYSPDQCYKFGYRKLPSLVVEVAWSQPDDDLRQKARNYITWSKGAVRTVVAVSLRDIWKHVDEVTKTRSVREEDFDYGAARAFIYRSATADGTAGEVLAGEDQIFRDRAGNLVLGADLHLSLKDFIPHDEARKAGRLDNPWPELIIDSAQLLAFTTDALRTQWVALSQGEEATDTSPSPGHGARRRVRRLSRDLKSLGSAIMPSKLRSGRR